MFVYCLATVEEPILTYVGATVDLERRLSQHNTLYVGGAKEQVKDQEDGIEFVMLADFLLGDKLFHLNGIGNILENTFLVHRLKREGWLSIQLLYGLNKKI